MRLTANQKVWIVLVVLVILSFIGGLVVMKYMCNETEWRVIEGSIE